MLKRAFDVLASGVGLIVLSPVLVVLALLVKFGSPGPVFYRANRVGLHGEPFQLFKFRSMVVGADKKGPAVTGAGDSRVTPIGRFLRRTKLDELPQLLNVLRGEMSVVGPRPEDPRYVAHYTPEQREVLNVRPGITSPASVAYRNEEAILTGQDWETTYIQVVMPAKLVIDLEYAHHPSLLRDIQIIFKTFLALFR
jgi:lipopolysaccharide/colanic/teichoic acid biosynthesis glycosyltransferase